MKILMTKENLMFAGIGLATAYVVYMVLVNREKKSETKNPVTKPATKSTGDTSSFCGCGA